MNLEINVFAGVPYYYVLCVVVTRGDDCEKFQKVTYNQLDIPFCQADSNNIRKGSEKIVWEQT